MSPVDVDVSSRCRRLQQTSTSPADVNIYSRRRRLHIDVNVSNRHWRLHTDVDISNRRLQQTSTSPTNVNVWDVDVWERCILLLMACHTYEMEKTSSSSTESLEYGTKVGANQGATCTFWKLLLDPGLNLLVIRPENIMLTVVTNYSIPVFPENKPIILWTIAKYSSMFSNYSLIIVTKLRTHNNREAAVSCSHFCLCCNRISPWLRFIHFMCRFKALILMDSSPLQAIRKGLPAENTKHSCR